MTEGQQPIKDLESIREKLVKVRRDMASRANRPETYNPGLYEQQSSPSKDIEKVLETQRQIDTIDQAIADENKLYNSFSDPALHDD